MTCTHLLGGIGPLICVRTDTHTTHTYESTSVSDGTHDDDTSDQ